MSGRWHLSGGFGGVLLVDRRADAPLGRAHAITPESAAFRVVEWFPSGAGEVVTRACLSEIAGSFGATASVPHTDTRALQEIVARALREGRLVAYRVEPVLSGGGAPLPAEPPPSEEPPPAEEKTWIAIELLTKKDAKPVAGARYSLKLPDGSTRAGSLNGQGLARVEGIDEGECDVDFPDYAPKEWGATPIDGGGFDYTVQQGDCLSSIAKQFKCADWHTIYDAPENAAFRELRPNPNIIYPGDKVHIPGRNAEPVSRATGKKHTFRLTATETRFRVRIQFGAPFSYHLDVEGAPHDGDLDDGAVIDVPIPPDARTGKLSIWPNRDKEKDPLVFKLALGSLDPVSEVSGVQARLNNLGFKCGKADGIVGPKTTRALRAFQGVAGLDVTGTINDATRDALRARHDL